jgi:DNA-binding transcriptional LysR family regulator
LAAATSARPTGKTSGVLRIKTLRMAAKKIIAPRLGRFQRTHPDVVLDIVIDDSLSDSIAGWFDAGIRVGERLEKDMIAMRLTRDVKEHCRASAFSMPTTTIASRRRPLGDGSSASSPIGH